MDPLKHVSTDIVRQRVRVSHDTMKGLFGPLVSQSKSERTLTANFEYGNLGAMPLCRLRSGGWMRLVRRESAGRASDSDFVKVSLRLRGTSYNEQRGLFPFDDTSVPSCARQNSTHTQLPDAR